LRDSQIPVAAAAITSIRLEARLNTVGEQMLEYLDLKHGVEFRWKDSRVFAGNEWLGSDACVWADPLRMLRPVIADLDDEAQGFNLWDQIGVGRWLPA
jgi:hypothetical protein